MTVVRQDAWTPDDDLILAEITLRNIREGGTQLKAFEEVGERIGRTAAACGFRWNSSVRKRYEEAIRIAKEQRQNRNKHKPIPAPFAPHEQDIEIAQSPGFVSADEIEGVESLTIDAVIRFLRQLKTSKQEMNKKVRQLEKDLHRKNELLEELQHQNEELSRQVDDVQTDYRVVNDDYKTLIQIMDRARKMAFLAEEDQHKPKFKMDANGNLERVE